LAYVSDVAIGWTDVVAASGGAVGAVTGVFALVVSWRSGNRSASAAEVSATASQDAVKAAERSADYADLSTREAQVISRIEKGRYHRELGPAHIRIAYRWTPTRTGGGVWAELTNDASHDLFGDCAHEFTTGGTSPLGNIAVPAKGTTRIFVQNLDVPDFGDIARTAGGWNEHARAMHAESSKHVQLVRDAFEEARQRFGHLIVGYKTAERCPCDIQPASTDYGHWTMRYPVTEVTL